MTLPFPADSAEYDEYVSVMEAMADEAEATVPDPTPEEEAYYEARAMEHEDRYLDSMWEDSMEVEAGCW